MILIDTDVLLDVALNREPHAAPAAELLDLLERRPKSAFVAWHTLANFYYMVRPARGADDARAFRTELTRFAVVAPAGGEAFRYAASLPLPDLEDAMQVAAAWSCGALFIATRNTRDFKRSPVPARTPAQLVRDLR